LLSKINPIHNCPAFFFSIHFNVALLSSPKSSQSSLLFRFVTKAPQIFLYIPTRAICPAHPILFDLITLIKYGEEYRRATHYYFISSAFSLGTIIFLTKEENLPVGRLVGWFLGCGLFVLVSYFVKSFEARKTS
jgi:hypothetical protein